MEVASVISQAAAPQTERVRNPASQSFIFHNSYPQPTHQATDSMASLKSDPNGRTPVEMTANGSALRGAKSTSAHATSFSATKVRPVGDQKQQPITVSNAAAKGISVSSSGLPSASMSRSSSRKSKAKTVDIPQLDDANEWPDVRDTLRPPVPRPEKEIGEKSATVSTSQKKGASCVLCFT